jgi:hypothetical protein
MQIPSIDKSNLFEFTTEEYQFALAGYPVWKAFVAYRDSNIWIESYFRINVSKRIIFFAKAKAKTQKELKEISILDQLICDDIEIERKRIEDFFSTIPENIIRAVAKFPDSHWEALESIILLGSNLLALINSNPVLAYIIINSKKINPSIRLLSEAEVLKKMILTKQKEVLSKCGFLETNQMVKIFSKMDSSFINVNDLINLRNLLMIDIQLKERILNILSFAKNINQNLLKLTIYNSPLLQLLSNKIIYELAASESFNEHLTKIKQLYLNSKRWQLAAPKIISLPGINKTFEKQLIAVEIKRQKENAFPPPPIEDNFYITAICQESDLVSWSKRQKNCIRSYAGSIKSKQRYFYKVINGKEEATLELKLTNGQIKKGGLLGTANISVSKGLIEIVDEWFKENKSKKKKVVAIEKY